MNTTILSESKDSLRESMRAHWLVPDATVLTPLLALADIGDQQRVAASAAASVLVQKLREEQQGKGGVDALLNEFALSTEEGVVLMCLAEALLRVPDSHTADNLIRDKLKGGDWQSHLGKSNSLFVNASAWGLLFTGKLVNYTDEQQRAMHNTMQRTIGRVGQPVIRTVVRRAMAIMGEVFVMGRSIESAMTRAQKQEANGYRYSYDMLGEGARTAESATLYFRSYENAIHAIGQQSIGLGPERAAGISVKLSALHPRYELQKKARVMSELVPIVLRLANMAKDYDIGFTIDAEEASRLDISLDVIEAVFTDASLRDWAGFGVAVQAYQKRAPLVIDWLVALASRCERRMMVRLVKGAYWDTEVKLAQIEGLSGYPVFTRKPATDICYQACARKMLDSREHLFPQFATHNAWTVAAVLAMDRAGKGGFEFQRLHGMGEGLYENVMVEAGIPCRIYAPVGEHTDLLAYLVRRLLENGANSSFVHNIVDDHVPIESLINDPVVAVRQWRSFDHPNIPLPSDIYGASRINSRGIDISDIAGLRPVCSALSRNVQSGHEPSANSKPVLNPALLSDIVGFLEFDNAESMQSKLAAAQQCFEQSDFSPEQRCILLNDYAGTLERHAAELTALCVREAGKTLVDSMAELREAVDFCRYYASECAKMPSEQAPLGVVLCISPWNFPLAIFVGQVVAALAAGNVVIAKPAEQTSLVALRAVELLQGVGIPVNAVQCVVAEGAAAGAVLVPDARIKAVLFTGSTATGRWLFETLAARTDAPVPLIAETGGQNCMIVDSTALPEQVVDDVLHSGFSSAGQRCSALRVLFLQEEIADKMINMIRGAMDELQIGDPAQLATDVGPIIDRVALQRLQQHVTAMASRDDVHLLHALPLAASLLEQGTYFAPHLYEIPSIDLLGSEVFGPVVHIVRYKASQLAGVVDQINNIGFGLTIGVHSRIDQTAAFVAGNAQVGNVYINRDMVGAVVGVQPFGGRGLSGTGPKAGGPSYLNRLSILPGSAALKENTMADIRLACPTGETNLLRYAPRGNIGLFYTAQDSIQHCRDSLRVARATGNAVLVMAPEQWHSELLKVNGGTAAGIEFIVASLSDAVASSDALVFEPGSSQVPQLMEKLVSQPGPIPALVCEAVGPNYWQRFVLEKVVTTDTTAAGGNATLMTLVEPK